MTRLLLLCCALVVATIGVAVPAAAQDPAENSRFITVEDPETRFRLFKALAVKLMREGRWEEALSTLQKAEEIRPGDRDLQITLAQAETRTGRYGDAVRRLEALRQDHPDWPRPRVELALTHEAAGDLGAAKAILIGELGRDPPPRVRRNLEARIRALEDRQPFVGRFAVGVVPDTNVNEGTQSKTVEYLGLPFQLNDDAKAQSGVRLEIAAGGTARTAWRENTRLELAADLAHSEPLGDEGAASSNIRLAMAARLRGRRSALATGLAVQPFYYDNELQRRERSVFFDGAARLSGSTGFAGNVTLTQGRYADGKDRDFSQWETALGPRFYIGRMAGLQLMGIFGHRNATVDIYSYDRRGGSAYLILAPGNGYRYRLAAALVRDRYKETSIAFGRLQEDLITAADFSLVKGDTVIWGFSPVFGLGYKEVRSTIDLFDKHSYSIKLGFARPY